MLKIPPKKDNSEFSTELQKMKDIIELVELHGNNIKNINPDQLKILELNLLECLRKIRGEKNDSKKGSLNFVRVKK